MAAVARRKGLEHSCDLRYVEFLATFLLSESKIQSANSRIEHHIFHAHFVKAQRSSKTLYFVPLTIHALL